MEPIFTHIYETNQWGQDEHTEYKGSSGEGSEIHYNQDTYVPFLKTFIRQLDIRSVTDLGCGNFKCGPLIYDDLSIDYLGYDTYEKIVNANKSRYPGYAFTHLDFYTDRYAIRSSDLCILKDVIQHWKMEEIYSFLDYLVETKKFKYILLCNCCDQSTDHPENERRCTSLSIDLFPLKKYNPVKLYNYHSKEVSVIDLTD
jgi:hypothetical protein